MTRDHSDRPNLAALDRVALSPEYEEMLEAALPHAIGDPMWKGRMHAEARDLLALASLAPNRLRIGELQMTDVLTAILHMRLPVPCRYGEPDSGKDDLVIAQEAVLGIQYPRDVLRRAMPGTAFIQVLMPRGTFHPNISPGPQVLCLGDRIALGIRISELVHMAFRAVVLQDHTIDDRDPAGLFNPAAARFLQENTHWVPLTDEPFVVRADREESEAVGHE